MSAPPAAFEQAVLPHLSAAFNLARWMTRDDHDAEDVVQQAYLRAFQAWPAFRGGDARAWLLTIVRNACYTFLKKTDAHEPEVSFEEELHGVESTSLNPEALLLRAADREMVRQALEELPVEFREVIVMREMEGLSYKEIASVSSVPVGTVMSRLNRGRQRLQQVLSRRLCGEVT